MPKLPVPEIYLKKQKRYSVQSEKREKRLIGAIKQRKAERVEARARIAGYEKEYAEAEKELVESKREAAKTGSFFVPAQAKVMFVIRIRGINGLGPKQRKILQLLRLRQIHNGVFVRVNKATINMLRLVEPYVAYGYPSLGSIRKLVYKRGYAKLDHQRLPLSDSIVVKRRVGKFGMTTPEDLIHEIHTCGTHFKEINSFFWPFKLSSPKGGFKNVTRHFNEGGDFGNREELINGLIKQML
ncbi:60S ribosomal protein L7 [Aduncisulcus paluster]|uniref:60S ribosomal protein L7 n=1 Tax=Aduncisulcus paluster TaxID=2918883 RepID=A0ABQ5K034_9EUKA|nr:60S ribosomal protein L7 [Aduncisulcus paluster]|eukprot:gnl/Carplike_NY0171/176_a259_5564.p1 GENE.gnl/Carplike_NY0171/176_a259_5564~~gnl/Carplike_NY0171/176_a259_5564.p1  ORF type:complete len:241 (+),score=91.78 gnl/Carplike_NY0171/176_a259_5564:35-757(+)